MSIFDEPTATVHELPAPKAPAFMSTAAGKAAVWIGVALVSALVGAFIARQGAPPAQPAAANLAQQQQPGGFGGPGSGNFGAQGGGGGFQGRPPFGDADDIAIAAKAIGVTETQLQTALQSGQSMAQVATAHGSSAQKVIDAIVAAHKSDLATAVKNGQLTQAQADQISANITDRVTQRVNGTGFRGGPPGGFNGGSPGGTQNTAGTRKV